MILQLILLVSQLCFEADLALRPHAPILEVLLFYFLPMTDVTVNFWAVLVAAVVQFVIGSVWYSPLLFAKPWMKLMKIDMANMKPAAKDMAGIFLGSIVGSLIMCYILAHFIAYAGVTDVAGGLQLGFWVWLGFIVTTHINSVFYEKRPFPLFLINAGHYLASLLAAGVILAVWR